MLIKAKQVEMKFSHKFLELSSSLIGGTVDIVESEPENDDGVELLDQTSSIRVPREKMVYMTVSDSQQEDEALSK